MKSRGIVILFLVPDVVEYGNWKYGMRSEGLISSAQSIGSKIGMQAQVCAIFVR